jgi:hypothetical protein
MHICLPNACNALARWLSVQSFRGIKARTVASELCSCSQRVQVTGVW